MNVKYFVTNDSILILNLLEKELCVRGISYVRIDNEVHFKNNIVRILDLDKHRKECIGLSFNKIEKRNLEDILKKSDCIVDSIDDIIKDFSIAKPFIKELEYIYSNDKNYISNKKETYKRNSNKTNMILKKSRR